MVKTTNQTWNTEVDMNITMIDQTKINKIFNKRYKLIMHLDEVKLKQQKELLYWLKKIIQLDKEIEKARKGKTIRKRLKK